jgi:uncharacterized YigZ family protein
MRYNKAQAACGQTFAKEQAMKPYKTLARDAVCEYTVHKSRFIGRATPAHTGEEALAVLTAERQARREANHHCYAYIIGQNEGVMRYSDDGEPGGTAGMPILGVLRARGVTNCVCVVTRYFGGVLLGAGGLTRAYSHTCALAMAEASVCEMLPTQRLLCEVEYPQWDRVQHLLKSLPVQVENTAFATAVGFELLARSTDAQVIAAELTRVTDGRITLIPTEEAYLAWPDAGEPEA